MATERPFRVDATYFVQNPTVHNPEVSRGLALRVEQKSAALLSDLDTYGYHTNATAFVRKATRLGVLAHTHNETSSLRLRRFDSVPFAEHPLDMAIEAARMRLHPTIVAACMLHDLPEDVKLGKLQNSEQWIKYIQQTFNQYPDNERLLRILRAEQKTASIQELFPQE